MSGTSAFFRGLTRAAQRPALTLLLAGSTVLCTAVFALPVQLVLGRELADRPFADTLLRGNLGPLNAALEGKFFTLLGPLMLLALLLQLLLRTFLAGGLFARLHPQGGGFNDSFFGLCARHFPTFAAQALLNGIFAGFLLVAALFPAGAGLKLLDEVETPRTAWLIRLGAMILFWVALSLGTRALDAGRAHIISRGGHRPVEGFLTGVKTVLRRPLGALSLSLWGTAAKALLFLLWLAADGPLHIHGGLSWLLAVVLLAAYLLAASFLRVAVAAGAFELISKN